MFAGMESFRTVHVAAHPALMCRQEVQAGGAGSILECVSSSRLGRLDLAGSLRDCAAFVYFLWERMAHFSASCKTLESPSVGMRRRRRSLRETGISKKTRAHSTLRCSKLNTLCWAQAQLHVMLTVSV